VVNWSGVWHVIHTSWVRDLEWAWAWESTLLTFEHAILKFVKKSMGPAPLSWCCVVYLIAYSRKEIIVLAKINMSLLKLLLYTYILHGTQCSYLFYYDADRWAYVHTGELLHISIFYSYISDIFNVKQSVSYTHTCVLDPDVSVFCEISLSTFRTVPSSLFLTLSKSVLIW